MASVHIIGAGVAGFTLAHTLIRSGYPGRVILSDPEGLPYDRPPLSKSLERVNLISPGWFAEHSVQLVEQRVTGIEVPSGEDEWLVLATGTVPKPLDIAGAEHARVIHSAADAQALGQLLGHGAFGTQVVVIGAGLIGAEFASAARQLGATVTLISNQQVPGQAVFGEPMARRLHADHQRNGVRVITGTAQRITADSVVVGQEQIPADIVVAAIGVTPNTELAEHLGLDTDDGILVDAAMRTGHRRVLAVGDATRQRGQRARRHWDHATEDAAIAAATIMGTEAPQRRAPWFWTDRHENHVEVVGDFTQAASSIERRNRRDEIQASFGLDAHGRLVAVAMADGGQLGKVARKLVAAGATPDPEALGDPSVTPRELAGRR